VVFFIFHEQFDEVLVRGRYEFENTTVIMSRTTGKEQAIQVGFVI